MREADGSWIYLPWASWAGRLIGSLEGNLVNFSRAVEQSARNYFIFTERLRTFLVGILNWQAANWLVGLVGGVFMKPC
jgi:hypothetical protein